MDIVLTIDSKAKEVLGYALRYWLVGNEANDKETVKKAHEILREIHE